MSYLDLTFPHLNSTFQHPDLTFSHLDRTFLHLDLTFSHLDRTFPHPCLPIGTVDRTFTVFFTPTANLFPTISHTSTTFNSNFRQTAVLS
ncbi:MAG: hypothetical protein HY841_09620 [Bacteroidetes bacterium]|nr:hypothetical protein [Bacteroidota bacterium]